MTSDPPQQQPQQQPLSPSSPLSYAAASLPDRGRRVSNTLLFVGILQTVMGPVATLAVTHRAAQSGHPLPPVAMHTYVMLWAGAAGLVGLSLAARWKPLPAAVAALGLYLSIQAVDAATGRIPLTQGIVFKLLMFAILARAIRVAEPRPAQ